MKNRQGFVSNSSSSSFCIFGANIGLCPELNFDLILKTNHLDEFKDSLDRDDAELIEVIKNYENDDVSFEDLDKINEYLEEDTEYIIEQLYGLSVYNVEGECYVGRDWRDMSGDETKNQFKERIKQELKELTGKEYNCDLIEKTYYS